MNKLVFQSDFGLLDGAISAMRGISYSVNPDLSISDLTHAIPAFNVWEASYRLFQTISYWPENTVFVSVVDPGVGSVRRSIVAKLKDNKYVVTPDNGTLTHLFITKQILEVRVINEDINRLKGSEDSYTFHGRDVYAFTGARLASEVIDYVGVGELVDNSSIVLLNIKEPIVSGETITGTIDILDKRFGSLWTNINANIFDENNIVFGDKLFVKIINEGRILYNNIITYGKSFSDVNIGETLIFNNSINYISVAINQGNFSRAYNIDTGISWVIEFRRYRDER